jgi:hypothetical protein
MRWTRVNDVVNWIGPVLFVYLFGNWTSRDVACYRNIWVRLFVWKSMLSLLTNCGRASFFSRSNYALSFVVFRDPTLCCFMQDGFFYYWGGTKSLRTAATSGLLYKPQMIDEADCGAIGGMKIGRGNRSTRRKPAPAPLCPPQIPHDQTRARTRAATVGSQRLTAWAMVRPQNEMLRLPTIIHRTNRKSIPHQKQRPYTAN